MYNFCTTCFPSEQNDLILCLHTTCVWDDTLPCYQCLVSPNSTHTTSSVLSRALTSCRGHKSFKPIKEKIKLSPTLTQPITKIVWICVLYTKYGPLSSGPTWTIFSNFWHELHLNLSFVNLSSVYSHCFDSSSRTLRLFVVSFSPFRICSLTGAVFAFLHSASLTNFLEFPR